MKEIQSDKVKKKKSLISIWIQGKYTLHLVAVMVWLWNVPHRLMCLHILSQAVVLFAKIM